MNDDGDRILTSKWWSYALIAAAVCYLTWVLGGAVNPALDAAHSFVAEYAADDQPGMWLFRLGDVLAGTLAGAAAVLFAKRSTNLVIEIGWWAVVAFGVATLLDAGPFSLTCAPSIDHPCHAAEQAGNLPISDQVHSGATVLGATGIVVAALAFAYISRAPLLWVFAVLLTAASATLMIMVLAGGGAPGLVQRVLLLLTSVWLAVTGWWSRTVVLAAADE